jgi:predicted lipid-binding transport protein (Tim44 family)
MIDLIVIALVAAIVVSRFTKFKLPKDPRDAAQRRNDLDLLRGKPLMRDDAPSNVVDITAQTEARKAEAAGKPTAQASREAVKHLSGLAKIKALDSGFREEDFLEGAKAAYGYFYQSWNAKDEEALENLCAPGLYDRVAVELQSDDWQPVQVDDLRDAEILSARVHGKTAVIEVQFESVEREGEGTPRTMRRRWVLARPLGSEDPNWELESMTTGADA